MPSYLDAPKIDEFIDRNDKETMRILNSIGIEDHRDIWDLLINMGQKGALEIYEDYKNSIDDRDEARETAENNRLLLEDKFRTFPQNATPEVIDKFHKDVDKIKKDVERTANELAAAEKRMNALKAKALPYLTANEEFNYVKTYEDFKTLSAEQKKAVGTALLRLIDAGVKKYGKNGWRKDYPFLNNNKMVSFSGNITEEEDEKTDVEAEEFGNKAVQPENLSESFKSTEQTKRSFEANTSLQDKLWYILAHGAEERALGNIPGDYLDDKEIDERDNPFPEDFEMPEDEQEVIEGELDKYLESMDLRDLDSIRKSVRALLNVSTRISIEVGKECKRIEEAMGDVDLKDKKADYIVYKSGSLPMQLSKTLEDYEDKIKSKIYDAIGETFKITPDTTIGELMALVGMSEKEKWSFLNDHHCKETDNIIKGFEYITSSPEVAMDMAKSIYISYIMDKLFSEEKESIKSSLNETDKYMFSRGEGTRQDERNEWSDSDWNSDIGSKYIEVIKANNGVTAYNNLEKIVSRSLPLGTEGISSPEGLFLNENYVPAKLGLIQEDKKEKKDQKVADVGFNWIIKVANKSAGDLRRMVLEPERTTLEKFKYNVASSVKRTFSEQAVKLIPGTDQLEAYKAMGLNDAGNAMRQSHYLMWILGTKSTATVQNVLAMGGDEATRQEYFEFCKTHAPSKGNMLDYHSAWGSVFNNATAKVRSYKLPEIDYSNVNEVEPHIGELYIIRTLSENGQKIFDLNIGKEGMEVLANQRHDETAKHNLKFWNYLEDNTRLLKDTYIIPKSEYMYNRLLDNLKENALNRFLLENGMSQVKGQVLDTAVTNGMNKAGYQVQRYFGDEFKATYELDIRDTLSYLQGNGNARKNEVLKDIYNSRFEKETGDSFESHQYNRMKDFRGAVYQLFGHPERKDRILKSDPVNKKDAERIEETFNKLFTKDILGTLAKNNMDEMNLILIDGRTPEDLWLKKYREVKDPAERKRCYKNEIVKKIFEGKSKIEIKSFSMDSKEKLTEKGTLKAYVDGELLVKANAAYYTLKNSLPQMVKRLKGFKKQLTDAFPSKKGVKNEDRFLDEGSDVYKKMSHGIEDAITVLENEKATIQEIREALQTVNNACKEYYKERKGSLFGPVSDLGKARLGISDSAAKATTEMLLHFGVLEKDLQLDYTLDSANKSFKDATLKEINGQLDNDALQYGYEHKYGTASNYEDKAHLLADLSVKRRELSELLDDIKIGKKDTNEYKASEYVKKAYLKEMMDDEISVNKLENMIYMVESGRIKDDIQYVASKGEFKNTPLNSLKDAASQSELETMNMQAIELEKNKIMELYNHRNEVMNKYSIASPESEKTFYGKIYHKQMVASIAVTNNNDGRGAYTAGRTAAISIAICSLAAEVDEKGKPKYTLEQLMNPEMLKKEKAERFDTVMQHIGKTKINSPKDETRAKANHKWIANQIYKGSKVLRQMTDELAKSIDYTDKNYEYSDNFAKLSMAGQVQYDVCQEMDHCEPEMMKFVKKYQPDITSYKDFKMYSLNTITPAVYMNNALSNITAGIEKLKNGRAANGQALVSSTLTRQYIKEQMEAWAAHKNEIPLSEYTVRNSVNSKITKNLGATSTIAGKKISDEFYKKNVSGFVSGNVFNRVSYDVNDEYKETVGVNRFPSVSELKEEGEYTVSNVQLKAKLKAAEKRYQDSLKSASEVRKPYIEKAKNALKVLDGFIRYDQDMTRDNTLRLEKCVRDIIAEKWVAVFEKEPYNYSGENLTTAVNSASDYMMKYDKNLFFFGKAKLDKLISTDFAERAVEASKEGAFMGKAGIAMNNLGTKDYAGDTEALITDAAYAMVGQILRINGSIPNDIQTGKNISASQLFNTLKGSAAFRTSLQVAPDNPELKSPLDIKAMATNDAARKIEIKRQEKEARDAEIARENAEIQRRMSQMNAGVANRGARPQGPGAGH